ncbi:hypothetical protein C5B28_05750, partial [Neisseria gonorrhoeae]
SCHIDLHVRSRRERQICIRDIYIYIYSGLTKIRTRRRAADSTDSTEPVRLVLHHLRESFPLS